MAKRLRSIDLDGPKQPRVSDPSKPFELVRKIGKHTVETRVRGTDNILRITRQTRVRKKIHGKRHYDVSESTKTVSALIPYKKIVAKFKVERDDTYEKPWENCDGWEHTCQEQSEFFEHVAETAQAESPVNWDAVRAHFRATAGYFRSTDNCDGNKRVVFTDPSMCDNYAYWHHRGASKQVARELAARNLRSAYEQMVTWYEDGWEWWYVTGEFMGVHESCGLIDDEEYAWKDVVHELAGSVAYQLEQLGFIVTGQPPRSNMTRERKLVRIKRQLHEQVPGSKFNKYY